MEEFDIQLEKAISIALTKAESNGDIVVTTSTDRDITSIISDEVKSVYSGGVLSPEEVLGICVVLLNAVENDKFYDWEMPTLSGFKPEEMKNIALKLRGSISV